MTLTSQPGDDDHMARLIPPVNFGMVEENLYRSGLPTELNFPFLERLRLKKLCRRWFSSKEQQGITAAWSKWVEVMIFEKSEADRQQEQAEIDSQ